MDDLIVIGKDVFKKIIFKYKDKAETLLISADLWFKHKEEDERKLLIERHINGFVMRQRRSNGTIEGIYGREANENDERIVI